MQTFSKMSQALVILAVLTAVLAYALYPYINAFFGAFILYVLFRPFYIFLTSRLKIKPGLAAISIIVLSIVIILIPLYILLTIVIVQAQNVLLNIDAITLYVESVNEYIVDISSDLLPVGINPQERLLEFAASVANYFSVVALDAIQSVGKRAIEFIIMYFLLFYLLVAGNSKFIRDLQKAFPFNDKNTTRLLDEFKSLVQATLISTSVIAIVQGGILTIIFILLDIEGAILWGFITAVLSFLPVIGPPVIWIPAALFQLLQQDYFSAAGVLIGGLVLSSIDNFLRPAIQEKVGKIHPLASLIGVIIGLNLFGLLGIFIGPLLLSYVVLMARMFHEEYLNPGSNTDNTAENVLVEGK
ncbi:AI-2E family transporter [Methanolobus halotolerans]|uniref:AI-2E family transporter n=1 Tax=Methanolobus halotolerans TaxID=2052935 RepID=A0A4E0QWU4_9EURY|nr:AI-2E family transporter [Methanolobus halotolerans]TGC06655.1 AI-2E family transporter [Methanolobus halotolerans]